MNEAKIWAYNYLFTFLLILPKYKIHTSLGIFFYCKMDGKFYKHRVFMNLKIKYDLFTKKSLNVLY
jgi:hypothetical protein